jgi:hypothetical protein
MKKYLSNHKKVITSLLIVAVISLIPVLFLFQKGFFLSDDGEWMVIRFSAFYQTLGNGQIPPRFFGRLNHGYGYPIGVFLYPAFMYIATPFKLLGLGYAEAIKAVIIMSFLASGIGSFFWLRQRFSVLAAGIGTVVYVYFPYHIYDLYVRGSIGELLAFGVLPFLLLAIEKKNVVLGSLLYGLLILSHNTFAFLLTPFLLGYTYFQQKHSLFRMYVFGLLVSAFFWLPSLVELPLTNFTHTMISSWQDYFLDIKNAQLLGFIAVPVIIGAVLALLKRSDKRAVLFSLIFLISIILASVFSTPLWELPILPKLVQFPWRFLILSVWAAGFLGAYLIDYSRGKLRYTLAVLLFLAAIGSAVPYLREFQSVTRDDGYYSTNEDTTTTHAEYMPKWVTVAPQSHPIQPVIITSGNGKITEIVQNSNRTQFIINAESPTTIVLNKIYYPGAKARVDTIIVVPTISSEGYQQLVVPTGEHTVDAYFTETPLRLVADGVSAAAILILIIWLLQSLPFMPLKWRKWYNNKQ